MKKITNHPSFTPYLRQILIAVIVFISLQLGLTLYQHYTNNNIVADNEYTTKYKDKTSTNNNGKDNITDSLQDELFTSFTHQLFTSELTSSTLGLHYTLESPENYGITEPTVTLGSFEPKPNETLLAIENQQKLLSTYNYDLLNRENQHTYDILLEYLAQAQESCKYDMFYEPLAPYTGLHTQLPILLSEFPIHSKEDIDIYLSLLKSVKPYYESLIEFQKMKSHEGYFMTDTALDSVIQDCQAFIDIPDNYLLGTFVKRIQSLNDIDDTELASYCQANEDTVSQIIIPAYKNLISELDMLRTTSTNELGLCYYDNGRNYYNYLIKSNTGSSRSTSEVATLIKSQIEVDLEDLQDALLADQGNPSTFFEVNNTPELMLSHLKETMSYLFPEGADVQSTIKEVPVELEPYLSPAFYLIPAIDSTAPNTIYLNNSHMTDNITMFTTLAHEGYPGHLYQTTYFQATEPDPIRSIMSYGGYVEGWATYVEMCSYYMIDLPDATIQQKNASLMLGLYAYTDIGIHTEGWTLADTSKFYKTYGITDLEAITRIFNLIKSTPTNYLKYYLGYVELLELKKECISKWGDTFSQKRFHEAVLTAGPTSFDLLRQYVLEQ